MAHYGQSIEFGLGPGSNGEVRDPLTVPDNSTANRCPAAAHDESGMHARHSPNETVQSLSRGFTMLATLDPNR